MGRGADVLASHLQARPAAHRRHLKPCRDVMRYVQRPSSSVTRATRAAAAGCGTARAACLGPAVVMQVRVGVLVLEGGRTQALCGITCMHEKPAR